MAWPPLSAESNPTNAPTGLPQAIRVAKFIGNALSIPVNSEAMGPGNFWTILRDYAWAMLTMPLMQDYDLFKQFLINLASGFSE